MRALAPTGVAPNHLTTLRCLAGIGAAVAFAQGGSLQGGSLQGGSLWPTIGGVVFVLSMLLDRADGELARQTGCCSAFGARYDIASDCGSNMLAMLGIGVGLMDDIGNWGLALGAVAAIGIGVLFWQVFGLGLATPQGAEIGGVGVDPDDALILVPIAVWCGIALPMLAAAATVTPLAAIWLGLRQPVSAMTWPRATVRSAGPRRTAAGK
jgi:phosphatidylglycerophosphate synthase